MVGMHGVCGVLCVVCVRMRVCIGNSGATVATGDPWQMWKKTGFAEMLEGF